MPVEAPAPVLPAELLATVPTPAYIYDLAAVRHNHASLRAALPEESTLYYSLKANPHPLLLAELRQCGARAEVCSTGELSAAVEAGWPAGQILYTGPGKRDAELAQALDQGVLLFSVDTPHALDQLDRLADERGVRARALLRVNDDQPAPGQGLAMTGVPSQFGADTSWILAQPERFGPRAHADVVGLHLYMGTNLTRGDDLLEQFTRSVGTARRLTEALSPYGMRLEVLDLGGGFGAPFAVTGDTVDVSMLRSRLTSLLDQEVPGRRRGETEVVFESGRYLVGTAGTLVTSVLDVKRSHGRDVVVLESGINHLGGMSGLRRLPPLQPHLITSGTTDRDGSLRALVTGPLCTPLDVWARNAYLPALRPGDRVAVPNTGAYGLYASLVAFLGHPLPAEAVFDSGRPEQAPHTSRLTLTRHLD
ncbi:alanine racemase [Streptomyces sp. MC1]|uniref:alanine racemase n=1 Tax=Streptomyces sp. MC1 TaxID=295105 RepID=UPI0018CAE849|nr:alanine racemase [Streptomyces sp. MC1]MBG7704682.1 alanine racemase [Streptomyces sp. MC1]